MDQGRGLALKSGSSWADLHRPNLARARESLVYTPTESSYPNRRPAPNKKNGFAALKDFHAPQRNNLDARLLPIQAISDESENKEATKHEAVPIPKQTNAVFAGMQFTILDCDNVSDLSNGDLTAAVLDKLYAQRKTKAKKSKPSHASPHPLRNSLDHLNPSSKSYTDPVHESVLTLFASTGRLQQKDSESEDRKVQPKLGEASSTRSTQRHGRAKQKQEKARARHTEKVDELKGSLQFGLSTDSNAKNDFEEDDTEFIDCDEISDGGNEEAGHFIPGKKIRVKLPTWQKPHRVTLHAVHEDGSFEIVLKKGKRLSNVPKACMVPHKLE